MSEDALYGDLEELAESATISNLRDQVAAAEEQRRAVEAQLKQTLADSEEGRKANEILATILRLASQSLYYIPQTTLPGHVN